MKLYPRKKSSYFFPAMYLVLGMAGIFYSRQALSEGGNPGNAAGFLLVFGVGMFIASLVKLVRPQLVAHGDYIEIRQSKTVEYVRFRHVIGFSRPDRMRIVLRLREEGVKREVIIWLKDLDERDIDRLLNLFESRKAGVTG